MPRPRKPTCAGNSSAKDTNEKLPMDKKKIKKKKKEHKVLKMDHQIQMFNPRRRAYYQRN